jgi:RNA polymerase sigma factor (sigma-70 family)
MAGTPDDDSIALVRRIQAGDDRAWDRLYLRHRDRLLLSIRCRLGRGLRARLESEDILHSVFRDVLADVHRFEPRDPGSFNRWLHVCVLNKIRDKVDHYGAQRRRGEVPLSPSLIASLPNPGDVEPRYADGERFERLEHALERLPDDTREVILLRLVEELPNQEAARALGKTPEAASKLYNRGLARLAVLLRGPAT